MTNERRWIEPFTDGQINAMRDKETPWQLIETAPKWEPHKKMNYIRILAHDGREVSVTYWNGYEWRCEAEIWGENDGTAYYDSWSPTHWMPLPVIS